MPLITPHQGPLIKLRLARDLVRTLKRGHPWVFADALHRLDARQPAISPGAHAILFDKKRRKIAKGFYTPHSPLAFRVCSLEPDEPLNDTWAGQRMARAVSLRRLLFDNQKTTGFRLFNGEGDSLPGLICDIYGDTAVIQLDGAGPGGFWHAQGIANWVAQVLPLQRVYLKEQSRRGNNGKVLLGDPPKGSTPFLEHGIHFTVDVARGQKTGFFLDQRENRRLIKSVAAGRRVLNLFGYTGGFSVYAGLGGAGHVTTVDMAGPALQVANHHWQLNNLPPTNHKITRADAFEFLEATAQNKKMWDLVIVDPPSFASSKGAIKKAIAAYQKLIVVAVAVTAPDGLLAAASCSSHIDLPTFLNICETGIAQARRRATLLSITGQPPDHPTPLPFSEFRYLKFVLMRVE